MSLNCCLGVVVKWCLIVLMIVGWKLFLFFNVFWSNSLRFLKFLSFLWVIWCRWVLILIEMIIVVCLVKCVVNELVFVFILSMILWELIFVEWYKSLIKLRLMRKFWLCLEFGLSLIFWNCLVKKVIVWWFGIGIGFLLISWNCFVVI